MTPSIMLPMHNNIKPTRIKLLLVSNRQAIWIILTSKAEFHDIKRISRQVSRVKVSQVIILSSSR